MRVAASSRANTACDAHHIKLQNGQATLEIVVSLMVVFALIFGLFEVCMLTYTCSVLNNAAAEGVRYAIVHGASSSNCSGPDSSCPNHSPYSNVQAVVSSAASASLHDLTAMNVIVTYADSTAAVGSHVGVTIVYTYIPYLNFPGLRNTVSFSSQGQILY